TLEIKAQIETSQCSEKVISNISDGVTALQHNITEVDDNLFEILRLMPSKNCADLYNKGYNSSEPVQIFPYIGRSYDSVSVLCDEDWTIIQRSQDVQPRVNFSRPWADYVQGFGELAKEFWLGLDH
ncbi:unnamed protein product, partial [Meganyctiphanes norvegica]